jgi:hypothetical protein
MARSRAPEGAEAHFMLRFSLIALYAASLLALALAASALPVFV